MKFLSILITIIAFNNCQSLPIESKLPFIITTAFYENWIGGQPGVKGTNVSITYNSNTNVVFDRIYFRKKIAKLQTKKIDSTITIIGYFNTTKVSNDIILNENPTEELNNSIPDAQKFPFTLQSNEAVISYKSNNKTKYHKIVLQKKQ